MDTTDVGRLQILHGYTVIPLMKQKTAANLQWSTAICVAAMPRFCMVVAAGEVADCSYLTQHYPHVQMETMCKTPCGSTLDEREVYSYRPHY